MFSKYIHTWMHTHTCIIHVHIYILISCIITIYTDIQTYIYIYIYTYTHTCTSIYTHIHISYIHAHSTYPLWRRVGAMSSPQKEMQKEPDTQCLGTWPLPFPLCSQGCLSSPFVALSVVVCNSQADCSSLAFWWAEITPVLYPVSSPSPNIPSSTPKFLCWQAQINSDAGWTWFLCPAFLPFYHVPHQSHVFR
jgi:hypothetical protein